MTSQVGVAVMAHPKRGAFVDELLPQLDRPAEVVWDAGDNSRWNTGKRAMLAHRNDPEATHWLVIQDDAIPCRDLVAGAEQALAHVPVGSPVSLYCGRSRPYGEIVQRLVDTAGPGTSWLTMPQCHWGVGIVMPTVHIKEMVAWCDQRTEVANYDKRISRWCQYKGLTVWYPWPSLVDHRESPSLVPGRSWRGRRAHQFIGADASALGQDWTGRVISITEMNRYPAKPSRPHRHNTSVPARTPKSKRLGVRMRFVSPKHPQLLVHPARIRFRNGEASTDDPAAIKVLLSPKVAALGVAPVEEPAAVAVSEETDTPAVAQPETPTLAAKAPTGDGEQETDAEEAPAQQPPADESKVPVGGAKEVLSWVGDDSGRARQALDAEQAREKPRSTLVAALTKLAE